MPRIILTTCLLFGGIGMASAGQIYKWVDAQGITHFSAQPPQGATVQTVPAAKQPPAPAAAAKPAQETRLPSQAEIDERVRREVAAKEQRRAEYCEKVRTNLANLHNNPRLLTEVGNQTKRLTEEERQARIAETERAIAEHCE